MSAARVPFRRPGGNATCIFDPLGWRVHRDSYPFIWLARKFRPGSRVNMWAYRRADAITNWHLFRRFRKSREDTAA
jgi:hypothetical protein